MLHEFHRTAADLILVVKPCRAMHCDAVMRAGCIGIDQLVIPSELPELFAPGLQKCHQIGVVCLLLLLLCEWDIFQMTTSYCSSMPSISSAEMSRKHVR